MFSIREKGLSGLVRTLPGHEEKRLAASTSQAAYPRAPRYIANSYFGAIKNTKTTYFGIFVALGVATPSTLRLASRVFSPSLTCMLTSDIGGREVAFYWGNRGPK